MLVPALLTRMSIRPSSLPTRSIIAATAALSVTSVATAIAFTPRFRKSSTAAADFASLRPTTAMSAPASASPRAMPRPMPPLPPVTIATLPVRSKGFVVIFCFSISCSAHALPDQDQPGRGEQGAIFRPLQAADHEARCRPCDRAGALADPEQPDRKREKAERHQQLAHGYSLPFAGRDAVRLETVGAPGRNSSMIRKSVKRFSEKIMLKQQPERDAIASRFRDRIQSRSARQGGKPHAPQALLTSAASATSWRNEKSPGQGRGFQDFKFGRDQYFATTGLLPRPQLKR